MGSPRWLSMWFLGCSVLFAAGPATSGSMDCPPALHAVKPKDLKALCQAAVGGEPKAQHNLGQAFYMAYGEIENNFERAYAWFHRAALQGLPQAQFALAILHLDNRGVRGTFPEAMAWLLKAAQQGHGDAQYLLGLSYTHGVPGTLKDMSQAERWLTQAADEGHTLAQEVLRNLRIKGLLPGVQGAESLVGEPTRVSSGACSAIPVSSQQAYAPYTRKDLEEALNERPETYVARMETCLRSAVSSQGPGWVTGTPR